MLGAQQGDPWSTRSSLFPARVRILSVTGRIRAIYSLAFFDERQAQLDIEAIDKESRAGPRR